MRLTYDEVIDLLKRSGGGRGADWNPDRHQMILLTNMEITLIIRTDLTV